MDNKCNVSRLGDVFEVYGDKSSSKVAKMYDDFLGLIEKHHF